MIKRLLDIFLSLIGLIVFSPIIAIVSWKIHRSLGSPVFFRQVRPGKDCIPFEMIKFRTMKNSLDAMGNQLPDSERMTNFGNFLRSTSLDELPELWNVIKGQMSIVGPRPLLMKYLPYYTEQELKRHLLRPGLTGLAQINGRNTASWEKRFELDVWYVENQSLALDIKIITKTIKKILKREDVVTDPCSVMEDLDVERSSQHDI